MSMEQAWTALEKEPNMSVKVGAMRYLVQTSQTQHIFLSVLNTIVGQNKFLDICPALFSTLAEILDSTVLATTASFVSLRHINFAKCLRKLRTFVESVGFAKAESREDGTVSYSDALVQLIGAFEKRNLCQNFELVEEVLAIAKCFLTQAGLQSSSCPSGVLAQHTKLRLSVLRFSHLTLRDSLKLKPGYQLIVNRILPFLCVRSCMEKSLFEGSSADETRQSFLKQIQLNDAVVLRYAEGKIFEYLFLKDHIQNGLGQLQALKRYKSEGTVKEEYVSYQQELFKSLRKLLETETAQSSRLFASLYRACSRKLEEYSMADVKVSPTEGAVVQQETKASKEKQLKRRKRERTAEETNLSMSTNPRYMLLQELHEIMRPFAGHGEVLQSLNDVWDIAEKCGGYRLKENDGTLLADYYELLLTQLQGDQGQHPREKEIWRGMCLLLDLDPQAINLEQRLWSALFFQGRSGDSMCKFFAQLLKAHVDLSSAGALVSSCLRFLVGGDDKSTLSSKKAALALWMKQAEKRKDS